MSTGMAIKVDRAVCVLEGGRGTWLMLSLAVYIGRAGQDNWGSADNDI